MSKKQDKSKKPLNKYNKENFKDLSQALKKNLQRRKKNSTDKPN